MIKRISFATRRRDLTFAAFAAAWPAQAAATAHAPPDARPSRVAVCTTLPELTGPDPRHDGIAIEWFADADCLRRNQDWQGGSGGLAALLDPGASPVVVADEVVLRGGAWLDQRWRDGGDRLKHMALAVRAAGLTPTAFSRAWRSRAGQVRRAGAAQVTVIPDEARGRAYVQNHPGPGGGVGLRRRERGLLRRRRPACGPGSSGSGPICPAPPRRT